MLSNEEIIEKYPWTVSKDDYSGENFCIIEDMPTGWRKAFGDEMLQEFDDLLTKYDCKQDYHIVQIKEKFGELRWYDDGVPHEAYNEYIKLIDKYTTKSIYTCIHCGKPATCITCGWNMPFCNDCVGTSKSIPIEEFYSN